MREPVKINKLRELRISNNKIKHIEKEITPLLTCLIFVFILFHFI